MNTHSTPQKNEAIYLITTSKQCVTDTKKKKKRKSAQGEEDFKNKGEVGGAGAVIAGFLKFRRIKTHLLLIDLQLLPTGNRGKATYVQAEGQETRVLKLTASTKV